MLCYAQLELYCVDADFDWLHNLQIIPRNVCCIFIGFKKNSAQNCWIRSTFYTVGEWQTVKKHNLYYSTVVLTTIVQVFAIHMLWF